MTSIVSAQTRIRHPQHFEIGPYSIVDDFCYISTRARIGICSHIASGCSIAGGVKRQFVLGDFCSLSSGVKVWCRSDDFVNDIVCIVPSELEELKERLTEGDVTFGNYTAVGSNSVVMPDNVIPEGTVVGALSFVPPRSTLEPWSVYAGIPVRRIGERNRASVMAQAARLRAWIETAQDRDKR